MKIPDGCVQMLFKMMLQFFKPAKNIHYPDAASLTAPKAFVKCVAVVWFNVWSGKKNMQAVSFFFYIFFSVCQRCCWNAGKSPQIILWLLLLCFLSCTWKVNLASEILMRLIEENFFADSERLLILDHNIKIQRKLWQRMINVLKSRYPQLTSFTSLLISAWTIEG